MGVDWNWTLGPAGPPLQSGVLVVLQSAQHFLFTFNSSEDDDHSFRSIITNIIFT